jgi:WD40 repeat protein
VNGDVPAELSAIAERALRQDPTARYPTARELLCDVEAYRSGARVGAYEYTTLDLLRRFLERHRTAVVASAVGLCVTLLLAIASYVRLAAARDRAREAERRATENERVARASERSAKESLSLVLVEKAEQAISEGDRTDAELLAAEALKLGERADARGVAIAADSAFRPEPVFTLAAAAGCTRYAMTHAPALLACARTDGISVFGLRDGALRLHAPSPGAPTALELSEDGTSLLRGFDGDLALLDLRNGGRTSLERHVGPFSAAALSADGKLLAWAMQNLVVVSEARDSGGEWRLRVAQSASALAFSPDARELVVGGELGLTTLWDFRTDRSRQLAGHTGTVRALAFAQQGRYLATGGADRSVRIWDTRDGVSVAPPLVHSDAITSLGFSADARIIAFGSKDKSFHVVELKDGGRRAAVRFHDDSVDWLALAPDGSEVASVSRDLGLERWSLASLRTPSALVGHGNVLSFAFVPGTDELVSAGLGTEGVGVWNIDSGLRRTRLPAGIDRVRALAISPDGRRLAFAGSEGRTLLWDLPAGVPLRVFEGSREDVRAVAFSSDGRWLAFAALDRVVHVVDAATFSPVAELDAGAPVQALAFSDAENVLVSGDRDGMLSLWNVGQKRRLSRFKAHDDWALAVAISHDGTRIASAGADRRIRVWDAAGGALVADLAGHEGRVFAVDFSSDGLLLASGAEDKTARLWNVRDAREVAVLTGHTAAVRAVHFATAHPLLATAGDDGVTRLWRLATLFEPAATLGARMRSRYKVALSGTHVIRLPGP